MTQFIFTEDFIIAKSEIVSVQFYFERTNFKVEDSLTKAITSTRIRGRSTIVFVLKDGTSRIIERRHYKEDFDILKNDVTNQMKAEPLPTVNKSTTNTTTTIRHIPASRR